jgi:peptidyl-Lys metalloendopeptidase
MTGTDSKGGTLVHEVSHFNVVAGTDDDAFGQTNAKNLARNDPAKALANADNYESAGGPGRGQEAGV